MYEMSGSTDCKEEVFDAYLTDILHFGYKSTSSNEGAHAAMKSYLADRTGDLLTVITAIHTKIQGDVHEIQAERAKTYSSKPEYLLKNTLFDDVINRVTVHGLKKIHKQYIKLKSATEDSPLGRCSHYFTKEMGLPCAHTLQLLISRNQKVSMSIVHSHWWYFRFGVRQPHQEAVAATAPTPGTLLAMKEPARIRQGRDRPKTDDRTTRRLPSAFELTRGRNLNTRPTIAPPPTAPTAPAVSPAPSTAAPTAPATAQKRTRGSDKQPRKKRAPTQKGKTVEAVAGVEAEVDDMMTKQRELGAAREAAVDDDVAAGRW